jgi:hypothetical protein
LAELKEYEMRVIEKKKSLLLPIDVSIYDMSSGDIVNITVQDVQDLRDMEDSYKALKGSHAIVSEAQVAPVYYVLKDMNCVVLRSHGEAEGLCSMLNRLGYADYVVSEDGDCFAYGASKMIRHWGSRSNRENSLTVYDCDKIVATFGMCRRQFTEICVLCGNDFDHDVKLRLFGFVTAFKNVRDLGDSDAIIAYKLNQEATRKKASKTPFTVPVGFVPDDPRSEFYCYMEPSKLFDYVNLKQTGWNVPALDTYLAQLHCGSVIIKLMANYKSETGMNWNNSAKLSRTNSKPEVYSQPLSSPIDDIIVNTRVEDEFIVDIPQSSKSEIIANNNSNLNAPNLKLPHVKGLTLAELDECRSRYEQGKRQLAEFCKLNCPGFETKKETVRRGKNKKTTSESSLDDNDFSKPVSISKSIDIPKSIELKEDTTIFQTLPEKKKKTSLPKVWTSPSVVFDLDDF